MQGELHTHLGEHTAVVGTLGFLFIDGATHQATRAHQHRDPSPLQFREMHQFNITVGQDGTVSATSVGLVLRHKLSARPESVDGVVSDLLISDMPLSRTCHLSRVGRWLYWIWRESEAIETTVAWRDYCRPILATHDVNSPMPWLLLYVG
ncbi:hypothetical protein GQ600_26328 [Phytophthora cactorum]|nr:hypothetical protein GQ600_26328 [Phytophthora cactorum]